MKKLWMLVLLATGLSLSSTAGTLSTVTAYHWTRNRCADLSWPVVGKTCAGPRNVPLGTEVWIQGVGKRTVRDRMNIRFPDRWDVFMPSRKDALKFGNRTLEVRILRLGTD